MITIKKVVDTATQKYREEKARLTGVALSRARMIKQAKDIPQISGNLATGPAKPIPGANVVMHDKQPMTFFTDGSLRNGYGPKPLASGRQLRKAIKHIRRHRKYLASKPAKIECHGGEHNIAHQPGCGCEKR